MGELVARIRMNSVGELVARNDPRKLFFKNSNKKIAETSIRTWVTAATAQGPNH